jgi:hypothetical protein
MTIKLMRKYCQYNVNMKDDIVCGILIENGQPMTIQWLAMSAIQPISAQ